MPLIPFIGLSILVHLIIILFKSFFVHKYSVKKVNSNSNSISSSIMGITVVLGVFSFVLFSASFLVQASVNDSHSLINYFEDRAYSSNQALDHLVKIKVDKLSRAYVLTK